MNMTKTILPIEYWNEGKTRLIKEKDENGRIIEVSYFFNCQFTGFSKHYPQPLIYSHNTNKLVLPTIEMFMSLGRRTVYEENMKYEMELPIFTKFYSNPVFYFIYNVANYYHFIYDALPYLYSYFNEKEMYPELKLLMSTPEGKEDLYPFVWECLELLGIDKNDVVFLNTETLYSTIVVGSSLTHGGLSNTPPHQGFFDIINQMKGKYQAPEKIYISRRTWLHNNLENIGTNYTERRRGAIGSGMCNVIFSPPNTKVISINSPLFFDINSRFEYSMRHTQLYHFNDTEFVEKIDGTIENQGALSISGGMNSPWKVNLNTLEKFLKKCLSY